MDEKTESLRDIFLDVADDETVVESQSETHGSIAGEGDHREELLGVVEQIETAFDRSIGHGDDTIVRVIEGFFAGDGDAAIAADCDIDAETVFETRMVLHCYRDDEIPIDLDRVADALSEGDRETAADHLDVDETTIDRAVRIIDARREARSVSHRFRTRFEDLLPDAEISEQMTASVKEDGLQEAAEDIETDVSL
ncbi:MAG: conditioned medium-induced protein 4 [Halococcoides sp.]